ncbi:MAG: Crp/Fnr family transcriptional regulator [Spirochaetales bacterium]|nr:Crp/Fnr family transcriptional regulator [Spirochaetales bacterium]
MEKIISVLSRSLLFKGLDEQLLQEIIDGGDWEKRSYRKGESIFEIHESYSKLSLILTGTVEIHRPLLNGSNLCIEWREESDLFGGATVFSEEGEVPGCRALAKCSVELISFSGEAFDNILSRYPLVVRNMNRLYSRRVLDYQQRLELFSYSSIKKKIAYYCLNILKCEGDRKLPFSRSKWAEYLNVSRPSLQRELKELERGGALTLDKRLNMTFEREILENYL